MTNPLVLSAAAFDQLHALVKWEFEAPIPLPDSLVDDLAETAMDILARDQGHLASTGVLVSFDEHLQLIGELEDGTFVQILRSIG